METNAINLRHILKLIHSHDLPAISLFKAYGGNLDRWHREDWLAMASALTACEDKLELEYLSRRRGREDLKEFIDELRTARRSLEDMTRDEPLSGSFQSLTKQLV
jgi:hypothetical protein